MYTQNGHLNHSK